MTTPNLQLPELVANELTPHDTFNGAIRRVDAVVQLVSQSITDTPPGSPVNGETYIVGSSPTGAFTGRAGDVAARIDGAWQFFDWQEGWLAYVVSDSTIRVCVSGSWNVVYTSGLSQDVVFNAKGDLLVGLANNSADVLTVAVDNQFLIADNAETTGLRYEPIANSGYGAYYDCENLGAGAQPFVVTDTSNQHTFRTFISGSTDIDVGVNTAGELEVSFNGILATGGRIVTGARIRKSANQNITNNTNTTVTWATEDIDEEAYFNVGTSTSMVVAPEAGWYLVTASILWGSPAAATGYRRLTLSRHIGGSTNGSQSQNIASTTTAGLLNTDHVQNVSALVYLAAGDTVRAQCAHTLGSTHVLVGTPFNMIMMTKH